MANGTRRLDSDLERVVVKLFEGLGGPVAHEAVGRLRAHDYLGLARMRVDPSHYSTPFEFWRDNAVVELLRKCPDLPIDVDLDETTFSGWMACERQCYKTNERLSPLIYAPRSEYPEALDDFFVRVRKNFAALLGTCPDVFEGRFGPGATVSDKSTHVTVADKMSSVPTITRNAITLLFPWLGTQWGSVVTARGSFPNVVRGNVYFRVDKTALVGRPCAKSPSILGFYQLSRGSEMKRRLRMRGIDLYNGQKLHVQLAREGSRDGFWCTTDLSSASDTVAYNLVKLCATPPWFRMLDMLRETHTQMPNGKWLRLEKFSAMGNGFTFELETTIFCAILMAASDNELIPGTNLFVYGDDLIFPKAYKDKCWAALRFCGLSVNERKSFSDGYFRESCGGDFFKGVRVRGFNLDGPAPTTPLEWISFANGLYRLCDTGEGFCEVRFSHIKKAWLAALDLIPTRFRVYGPERLGDTVVHTIDESRHTVVTIDSIEHHKVVQPQNVPTARWEGFSYDVQYATALYYAGKGPEAPVRDPFGNIPTRGKTSGTVVRWSPRLPKGWRGRAG